MIIEKMMKEWEEILFNEFDLKPAVDEMGTKALLDFLLDNVGNLNSLVRENVAMALWTLLGINERFLSDEEYVYALDVALSDAHLFKGVGGEENDDAFMRAFASLLVRGIMMADNIYEILTQEQYEHTLNKAIQYLKLENDRRSFIHDKGTVHAPCHGMLMVTAIIHHKAFSAVKGKYVERILDVVKKFVVCEERFAAVDWADNIIAKVIPGLLIKGVNDEVIKDWIEKLLPDVNAKTYTNEHHYYVKLGTNIEHFLMCVYFALKAEKCSETLGEWIVEYLPKLKRKVYP
ncbi:MAG: DUF2785 domain-containing protein [Defluviitaleaceae bacterium]|nr:DUF2785 domain-containing protein [Defluviitaleaceae bacterium]